MQSPSQYPSEPADGADLEAETTAWFVFSAAERIKCMLAPAMSKTDHDSTATASNLRQLQLITVEASLPPDCKYGQGWGAYNFDHGNPTIARAKAFTVTRIAANQFPLVFFLSRVAMWSLVGTVFRTHTVLHVI